jgi:hypothetical protein
MANATITEYDMNLLPGFEVVKLTQTGTTSRYYTKKFKRLVAAWATNTSDDDGVLVSDPTNAAYVDITTVTATDVVYLVLTGVR